VGNDGITKVDKLGMFAAKAATCPCIKIEVTRGLSFPSGTFGEFKLFLNDQVKVRGATREPAVGGPRGPNVRNYPIPGGTYNVHVGSTQWSTFGKGLLFSDQETSPFQLIRFHMPIGNNAPVDSRDFPITGNNPDDTGALGKGCIWVGSHFEAFAEEVYVPHFPAGYPYRNMKIPGYKINRHRIIGGQSTLRSMVEIIEANCGSRSVRTTISEPTVLQVPPNFNNSYRVFTYTPEG
jgi:hypothetical protein